MTMGEKIKQLRSANGFTQEMLAEKANGRCRCQLRNAAWKQVSGLFRFRSIKMPAPSRRAGLPAEVREGAGSLPRGGSAGQGGKDQ